MEASVEAEKLEVAFWSFFQMSAVVTHLSKRVRMNNWDVLRPTPAFISSGHSITECLLWNVHLFSWDISWRNAYYETYMLPLVLVRRPHQSGKLSQFLISKVVMGSSKENKWVCNYWSLFVGYHVVLPLHRQKLIKELTEAGAWGLGEQFWSRNWENGKSVSSSLSLTTLLKALSHHLPHCVNADD